MRTFLSAMGWACFVSAMCGCQSWSQIGQGIPNGSRVAPPGTGSYNVPSSYYNGSKAGPASVPATNANTMAAPTSTIGRTAGMQPIASQGSGVAQAAWQPPTVDQLRNSINGTASAAMNDASNRANQVVQASTSRAAAAVQQYTDPAPIIDNVPPSLSGANSQSISDNAPHIGTQAPPKLDWQAPR